MKIELGFRDITLPVEVPERNLQAVLQPSAIENDLDEAEIVRRALAQPIGTPRLCEIVKPGQKIVIVTSDITRPRPTARVMPFVLEELDRAGVRDEDVTLVFATGVHRKPPAEECRKLAGDLAYSRIRCIGSDNEDVEDADGTEDGAEGPGSGAVFPGDDGKLGDAAALPQLSAVEEPQGQAPKATAQGEPPARESELEGKLGRAHGGLAPHQTPHDRSSHQKGASPAAAGEKV